jgi:predicted kinase
MTIYLLCGKTGSGKTTFAQLLETKQQAFRLSVDEPMLALFGPHMPRELFDERLRICKEILLEQTERLITFGVSVVLDWGFWKKAERRTVRDRFVAKGARCELIYFEVSDEILLERLRLRNSALPTGTYETTEDMFRLFSGWFEPPEADEEFRIVATGGVR